MASNTAVSCACRCEVCSEPCSMVTTMGCASPCRDEAVAGVRALRAQLRQIVVEGGGDELELAAAWPRARWPPAGGAAPRACAPSAGRSRPRRCPPASVTASLSRCVYQSGNSRLMTRHSAVSCSLASVASGDALKPASGGDSRLLRSAMASACEEENEVIVVIRPRTVSRYGTAAAQPAAPSAATSSNSIRTRPKRRPPDTSWSAS